MLEQLVECENRLLEEQRRFNELLLAWRSGDLGDDLTRMKIDQMQREVDALGRQLTALRTVIAAQADRERAGYRQGAMPKAAYGWYRRMDSRGAAAQPWDQTMPRWQRRQRSREIRNRRISRHRRSRQCRQRRREIRYRRRRA